jgi:hypothetical protein
VAAAARRVKSPGGPSYRASIPGRARAPTSRRCKTRGLPNRSGRQCSNYRKARTQLGIELGRRALKPLRCRYGWLIGSGSRPRRNPGLPAPSRRAGRFARRSLAVPPRNHFQYGGISLFRFDHDYAVSKNHSSSTVLHFRDCRHFGDGDRVAGGNYQYRQIANTRLPRHTSCGRKSGHCALV